jgi:hypothetical protein
MGKQVYIPSIDESMPVLGAGYSAIVLHEPSRNQAIKIFISLDKCSRIRYEATLQAKIVRILKKNVPDVFVPTIIFVSEVPLYYASKVYMCGIGMTYLPSPIGFDEAVHMCLGYHQNDLDTSWGQNSSKEVSETNPTRGFFASPTTLEYLWQEEGSTMTIENLAYLMGKTYRSLIDNGIVPIDVEWIWSKGMPCLIDCGECIEERVDPYTLLNMGGSKGLESDFYIPHSGDRGYEEFRMGYGVLD